MKNIEKSVSQADFNIDVSGKLDPLDVLLVEAQKQNPDDYELPEEFAGDPGLTLRYVCAVNFPDGVSQGIQTVFSVSRQSAWLWCRPGMGIPATSKARLIELTTTKKNTRQGIKLPRGVEAEALLRKGSLQGRPPFSKRNQFLLSLLSEVVSGKHEGLDLGTLDALVSSHLPMLVSPHRIWQWAYAQGGIPESYVGFAQKGMIHYGFNRAVDMEVGDFVAFLKKYLVAQPRRAERTKKSDDLIASEQAGSEAKKRTGKATAKTKGSES